MLWKRRFYPADSRLRPVDIGDPDLEEERKADQRDKHNDQFFNPFVSTCKLTDQNQHENHHAAELDRNAEQHLERNRTAEDLRHCGRHRCHHRRRKNRVFQPRRQIEARRLREALSRDNAEMRRIVLQKNQHDRGQGDHPQKLVAVTRSGGNVGCPVSRVDKTDRDKKSRAEIAEKIHARRLFSFSILFHILSFLTI